MKIIKLTVENLSDACVTDNRNPRISFAIGDCKKGAELERAEITVGNWSIVTDKQILVPYAGAPLAPFTEYKVKVAATDSFVESDVR